MPALGGRGPATPATPAASHSSARARRLRGCKPAQHPARARSQLPPCALPCRVARCRVAVCRAVPCVLVTAKGVPDLATRAFAARLLDAFPGMQVEAGWGPGCVHAGGGRVRTGVRACRWRPGGDRGAGMQVEAGWGPGCGQLTRRPKGARQPPRLVTATPASHASPRPRHDGPFSPCLLLSCPTLPPPPSPTSPNLLCPTCPPSHQPLGLVDFNPSGALILATYKYGSDRLGAEGRA
jgi:hypothetical protein